MGQSKKLKSLVHKKKKKKFGAANQWVEPLGLALKYETCSLEFETSFLLYEWGMKS
jgi:hypothetical protein